MADQINKTTKSPTKKRLLGVDFGRGLAAYAVILLHSGDEAWGLPINASAVNFRQFFHFAVPFFLATAFYFTVTKINIAYSQKFWISRIKRIAIPYTIWSLIFLVFRIIIFIMTGNSERLQGLLQDPVSIIFFGGASYHLYFLPTLFIGSVLTLLLPLFKRFNINLLGCSFLSILGLAIYHLLVASGNSFNLGTYVAFQELSNSLGIVQQNHPIFRIVFMEIYFLVRCLPYFLIAITLTKALNLRKRSNKYAHYIWLGLFLISSVFLKNILSEVVFELLTGFTVLMFSITLSEVFSEKYISEKDFTIEDVILNLGKCSFGIYLIHPFAINTVKPLLNKTLLSLMNSITIPSIIIISVLSFLLSWLLVAFLSKSKTLTTYLFGA